MDYFDFQRPTQSAPCADDECACPKDPIEVGTGYLYVSNKVIRDRRNDANGDGEVPLLVCKAALRQRDLDSVVAAEDAAHWWKTGRIAMRATPRRELKFKDFLGTTLVQAKQKARDDLGSDLIGTDVARDVQPMTMTGQGPTVEEANQVALERVAKEGFDIEEPKIIQEGQRGEVEVEAFGESDARRVVRGQALRGAQLISIENKREPKNGVMGIGKKPAPERCKAGTQNDTDIHVPSRRNDAFL